MSTTAFHRSPFIEWGVATQPIPGQTVCGEVHRVKPFAYGALVAVVDGLGHCDEAIAVARIAIDVLTEQADQSVITLVKRCHEALIDSRGVVLTLASFNTLDATVSWLSVGNVAGLLLRADSKAIPPCETALLRCGPARLWLKTNGSSRRWRTFSWRLFRRSKRITAVSGKPTSRCGN